MIHDNIAETMARKLCLLLCLIWTAGAVHAAPRKKARPAPAPAAAAPEPAPHATQALPKIDSELLLAGVHAYDDLEYAKCVESLQKALGESLTRDEKVVLYRTLAFCHVALDKPEAAKFDFENLLRIDETFELDRRISPRIRAPFEEAKAAIATGMTIEGQANEIEFKTKQVTPTMKPAHPTEGMPVDVAITFGGGLAVKAELFYRTRGQAVFNKLTTAGSPEGDFTLTVPGTQVQAPQLEYYLVLLDDSNTSLARAGSLSAPLRADVTVKKKPVYAKAWFWGVVAGVVVAGAVVGGVVAGTAGTSIGKTTPASVTIMPQ